MRVCRMSVRDCGLNPPQAAALIQEQLESVWSAHPPKRLLEFMVQRVTANQLYLLEHVPDVFEGDMVIFSAARGGNGNQPSHVQTWRPYVAGEITAYSVDCTHLEMLTNESLSTYGEQLKRSLESQDGVAVKEFPAPVDPLVD